MRGYNSDIPELEALHNSFPLQFTTYTLNHLALNGMILYENLVVPFPSFSLHGQDSFENSAHFVPQILHT